MSLSTICLSRRVYVSFFGLCLLFTADTLSANERVIFTFNGEGGMYPTGLISDAAGNLYGATEFTPGYGPGTIFKLARNGSSYTFEVLYAFTGNTDGISPSAPLVLDAHGNLYGTTGTGGDNYKGSVFELSPNQEGSWTFTILYSFADSTDGGYLYGGVILDAAGNLYGTASEGGLLSDCSGAGCGVVFELSPGSDGTWSENVLHSFAETEGALPSSGLAFGAAGVLYGTTAAGGTSTHCEGFPANGCGTVFKLESSAGGWAETTLHSFDVTDGYMPQGVTYHDGRLFGTTFLGGAKNAGSVYELTSTHSGMIEYVLHSFGAGNDATQPLGTVVFDKNGNLYGAASHGGDSACNQGCGAIFKLSYNSGQWTEMRLHEFTGGNDGAEPYGTPIVTTSGILGAAIQGGASSDGVIFELSE